MLTADTLVAADGTIFGKPSGAEDARRMLRALSGRSHRVATGVAVARGGVLACGGEEAEVRFRDLLAPEIEAYVASGEPLDKAGAYAIQGGAAGFVADVRGSTDTVVGLPVALALRLVAACERLAATADGERGGPSRP